MNTKYWNILLVSSSLFEDTLMVLECVTVLLRFEMLTPIVDVVARTAAKQAVELFLVHNKMGDMLTMPIVAFELCRVTGSVVTVFTEVLPSGFLTVIIPSFTRLYNVLCYGTCSTCSSKAVLSGRCGPYSKRPWNNRTDWLPDVH